LPAPRRGKAPEHLADLDAAGLRAAVGEVGLPGYRADQLARQYYGRFERDPDAMTDLPFAVRADVRQRLLPRLLTEVRQRPDRRGDGRRKRSGGCTTETLIESVLMRYSDRVTLCVSSQAGCGMACPFCATGQGGLERNLSTAEIVEQVVAAASMAVRGDLGAPARLSNVVFMGMGEPLANPARVHAALHRLIDRYAARPGPVLTFDHGVDRRTGPRDRSPRRCRARRHACGLVARARRRACATRSCL
jgi:23S rRNA (adenine2503-C2)-methyltransferase